MRWFSKGNSVGSTGELLDEDIQTETKLEELRWRWR